MPKIAVYRWCADAKKGGKRVISVEVHEWRNGERSEENRGRERAVMFAYEKFLAPSDSRGKEFWRVSHRADAFYRKRRLMRRASREPQEMFPRNSRKDYPVLRVTKFGRKTLSSRIDFLFDFRYFSFLNQAEFTEHIACSL